MAHVSSYSARSTLFGRSTKTQSSGRRKAVCSPMKAYCGVGESMKKFFDSMAFENWAPRSSRTWRLGKGSGPRSSGSSPAEEQQQTADEDFVNSLNARISEVGSVKDSFEDDSDSLSSSASFQSVSDDELASSFTQRLGQVSSSGSLSEEPLTGQVLRDLVFAKYGKTYDLSIVRRQIAGVKLVALNVMWTHLDQRSFPMTEGQFMEKLDTIAEYLRMWGQEDLVRDFLLEPPKSRRGLPSRPVTGNAVSIRLELEPSIIAEWFGS